MREMAPELRSNNQTQDETSNCFQVCRVLCVMTHIVYDFCKGKLAYVGVLISFNFFSVSFFLIVFRPPI